MKNRYFSTKYICIFLLLSSIQLTGQDEHSFQWKYRSSIGAPMRNLDVLPTEDFGYIHCGLIEIPNTNGVLNPYIFRTDCQGKTIWAKQFSESTEGANNINARILPLPNNEYILLANIGFFFSSPKNSIFLAKIDGNGNVKWTKKLGGGTQRQTVIQDAIISKDGNILLAGQTGSFGSDSNNNDYTDQYFVKLSPSGNIIWSKTYGNPKAIDRCFAIIELADNSIVAAGSYLHAGTFYANLLKMDTDGKLQWNKVYGDSIAPHANHAYGLIATKDGGFLLSGSTSNAKENFQSYPDMMLIKTDANGEPQWTRAVAGGASDSFENAANCIETVNGDFAVICATNSYPSTGFVANKYVMLTISSGGSIKKALTYNQGSSHYPRLIKNKIEGGNLITGFTNWSGYGGDNNTFDPILINTDHNLEVNDCFTNDVTILTSVFNPVFDYKTGTAVAGSGGNLIETITNVQDFDIQLNNLCEKNGFSSCSTGISNLDASQNIQVQPNPALENVPIQITWDIDNVQKIEVIDSRGMQLQKYNIENQYKKANICIAEKGVYFVKINNDRAQITKKLIVIQ